MNYSQQIAEHIKGVYFGGNWTASNLHNQLQNVDLKTATTKIHDCNTIATLAYHIHYFVIAQSQVLEGKPLQAKDSESFSHPNFTSNAEWTDWKNNIFKQAKHFINLVKDLPEEKLSTFFQEEKYGLYYKNLHGLIEHTHFHLGQIALVKKLIKKTSKKLVVKQWESSKKIWMTENEFTGIVVGKEDTNSEYVITDGIIEPDGFIPNHYHKWEDQTFHIIEGILDVIIGKEKLTVNDGSTIHCPKGIAHYMKNIGKENAKVISYIFPGDWAEDFIAETSRQVKSRKTDLQLIEDKYGVVYL